MSLLRRGRAALRTALFGPDGFRHQCLLGLPDPQNEVGVWFEHQGALIDVTHRHAIAAAVPMILAIRLDSVSTLREPPTLRLREQGGGRRLLGEIGLRPLHSIQADRGGDLHLFKVTGARNYCASHAQLGWVYLAERCHRLLGRDPNRSGLRPTARDARCGYAFYICPRPIVVVSVMDEGAGNMFPMDLVGSLGSHTFSLALHRSRAGVPLMERSRRIAVSNVPVEQAAAVFALGKHHRRPQIVWQDLPFPTTPSAAFGLPVPSFALRVREMRITAVHAIGDYRMFLAEIVEEHSMVSSGSLPLHIIHGFYHTWRRVKLPGS